MADGTESTTGIDGADVDDSEPGSPTRADRLLLGLLPLAIGLAFTWMAVALPPFSRHLALEPRAFPLIIGIAMAIVGFGIAVCVGLGLWNITRLDASAAITSWPDTIVAGIGIIVFVAAFQVIGFAVSTFLLVSGLATMTSRTRWRRNVLTALIFAAACQYLFGELLAVRLPAGLLGFWL